MGNEMGNNNTSELREEEDNKITETGEKLKEENNVVSIPEDIDCNGKDSEFLADDDDPKATIHTNGKESLSEETEVHLSIESPESERKLIEKSSIATEFQITNPLPERLEDCRNPNSSNSEDNVSVMSKDEIGNESLFEKEEEDTVNPSSVAIALTRHLESEDSAEQESKQVEAVQSEQEEISSQQDSRPTDERFEVGNGDGFVEAEILKENDEDKDVFMPEETKLIAKESLNADDDSNSISVDPDHINGKSKEKGPVKEQTLEIEENTEAPVLTEDQLPITVMEFEADQVGNESKAEGKLETAALHFDVKSTLVPAVELPIQKPDEAEAIQLVQSESIEGNVVLVREIHSKQESEENKSLEDRQTLEISEKTESPEFGEPFKPSFSAFLFHPEDQQQKTATYTEDAQVLKFLASELKLKTGSEFLEAEALPINTAATSIREKKEDNKPLEMEAKSEKPAIAEAYKPSFPASLLHSEDQQQKTATNSEDNRAFDHSTSEVKLESNSQFLGVPSSPFYTLMEMPVDLPIGKPEEAEAISVQTLETPKILTETSPENPEDLSTKPRNRSVPEILTGKRKEDEQTLEIEEKSKPSEFAEEYKPSFPDSLLYPEDQRQKTAANCKDDRVFGVSTSEVKLESNSDLPIEKPEEAETLEILTEPNPSGSENDSTKSCNGPNPDISKDNLKEEKFPGSNGESKEQTEKVKALTPDNKEQETTARFSIESNPDSYISRPEMRKSPSFGPDLRIESAKTKESDQTLSRNQNKDTSEQDVSLQASLALEKSNSKKLKLPFQPEPKQQDWQVSAKKDKHRGRSSLFTNCMCCTTVLN